MAREDRSPGRRASAAPGLRVRITAAQAKESALWVAGRCRLHRPAPECTVQVGAGVRADAMDSAERQGTGV